MESFSISRTQLGSLYSSATLIASFALPLWGRLMDRYRPIYLSIFFATFVAIGFTILGLSTGMITIFIGFLIIRGFGQAAFPLVGMTAINKSFGRFRGKAMALASIGRSVGEGIIPSIVASLLAFLGWRYSLFSIGGSMLIIFSPLAFLLIKDLSTKVPMYPESERVQKQQEANKEKLELKEIYKDKKLYLILFANALLAFILTGVFFQQHTIMEYKSWDISTWTTGFSVYAVCQFSFSMIYGHLVDRFSARKLLPLILTPLLIGLISLIYGDSYLACFIFLGASGASIGTSMSVRSAFLAEAYGTKNLATIKGTDSTFIVVGTSIAPVLFAFIIDSGVNLDHFLLSLCALVIFGISLFAICARLYR